MLLLSMLTLGLWQPALADEGAPPSPVGETRRGAAPVTPEQARRWQWEPFIEPTGGASMYSARQSDGQVAVATAVGLGLQGGVMYADSQTPLAGRTRASGQVLFGSYGGLGSDLRVGSFIGPQQKWWTVQTGPDLFRNTFIAPGVEIPPSVGVDWVVNGRVGLDQLYLLGGVQTAWLADPNRRVQWDTSDHLGVGHEFGWTLGVMVAPGPLKFGLVYSRRVTVAGLQHGFGVAAGF